MKRVVSITGVILLGAAFGFSALEAGQGNPKRAPAESQKGGLPALEDRVEKLEGEVATLNSEVATLNSEVATLNSEVASLQTAVNTLQMSVSALQSAVTALQNTVAMIPTTVNWAVVNSSGSVVRASGNAPVTATRMGPGVYEVTFANDVSACAYVATIGDAGHVAPSPGQITVSGDVDGGNPNDVQVQTFDKTGTAADASFHVYVSCPLPH